MTTRHADAARQRQRQLTKPPGSLGQLEDLAVQIAAIQRTPHPHSRPAALLIFASDHAVVKHGVSAYPQSVTGAMMRNFSRGGAASTVLARTAGVPLQVVDVGVVSPYDSTAPIFKDPVAARPHGDLRVADAMDRETFEAAVAAGRAAVVRLEGEVRTLILGEMGIGNSTPAAAVICALLNRDPRDVVGPGTGVTGEAMERKIDVVTDALTRAEFSNAPDVVRTVGGREIAAMMGAALEGTERGLTILVDGFIVTASLLAAVHENRVVRNHLVFGHRSGEPGHRIALKALDARPLLDIGLRLGEGTGALCALSLLDGACATHNEMSTFAESSIEGPV